jgi:RNA polymerase subunit RPABC4/transcription elongation factor Spt4
VPAGQQMARCRQCDLLVSGAAEICPRCGNPLPARFHFSARWVVVAGILVVVLFAAVWRDGGPKFDPNQVAALLDKEQSAAMPSSGGSSLAATSQPFVVAIEASISGGARPIVTGTTNLPNGTQLMIQLQKPWLPDGKERLAAGLPACGDDCFPLQTNSKLPDGVGFGVVVRNGHFSDGPFTDNKGAPLRPGKYVLEVSAYFAATQPGDVRATIGPLGENMTGPLVGGCCFGPRWHQAEIQKNLDEIRRDAPILGAIVYYARYMEIGEQQQ